MMLYIIMSGYFLSQAVEEEHATAEIHLIKFSSKLMGLIWCQELLQYNSMLWWGLSLL